MIHTARAIRPASAAAHLSTSRRARHDLQPMIWWSRLSRSKWQSDRPPLARVSRAAARPSPSQRAQQHGHNAKRRRLQQGEGGALRWCC